MTKLVQLADEPTTDVKIVRLIGNGEDALVSNFSYVVSEDDDKKFFLQIVSPNRNLSRFSSSPFDVTAMSQVLELINEESRYAKESLISHVRFYEAEILKSIDASSNLQTAFTRPSTGAVARLAETKEIIDYLNLPTHKESDDLRIGQLSRSGAAEVPIILTDELFDHHMLVAGATGSGKSELLSNIAHVADAMERCVILFDHKPDHQDHHAANDSAGERKRAFREEKEESTERNGIPLSAGPVRYWTLDPHDPKEKAKRLGVQAMKLNPEMLAGAIFWRNGEELQAETFNYICRAYKESHNEWTVHELVEWVCSINREKCSTQLFGDKRAIHQLTWQAIYKKIQLPSRIPSFIDPKEEKDALGKTSRAVGYLDKIDNFFQPGLNVIRIPEEVTRGYALFLSYLLGLATKFRKMAPQPSIFEKKRVPKMLIVIDEAADIFKADSKFLRDAATGMLAERIRKGRSLGIGYVIAVQDAGDVPETIRHNLNTIIAGRHRHLRTLREALPTVQEGLISQVDKLMPGEMLVDMFGVPSLLLVRLDRSRSKLTTISTTD